MFICKNIAIVSGVVLLLSACAPANVSSNLRDSGVSSSPKETRCVSFDTGNKKETDQVLSDFDGWKTIYASEYTTANKVTTTMTMCFEKY